jgi:cytochrome P450
MEFNTYYMITGICVCVIGITITYIRYLISGTKLSKLTGIKWISCLPMIFSPKDVHEYLNKQTCEHGPIVMQNLGIFNNVIVCDAEIVQYILKHDNKFVKMVAPTSPSIRKFCGDTIMNTNGDNYSIHKKPISLFLSHATVQTFYPKFNKQADMLVQQLEKCCLDNQDINIGQYMVKFTLDVLGDTVLGINMGALDGNGSDISRAIEIFTREITNPIHMIFPNFEKLTFLNCNKETQTSLKVIEKYIDDMICNKKKKKNCQDESSIIHQYDMFDCIFDNYDSGMMDNHSFFGNIISLMIAGYETTATSLTWIMYFLATHPDIQEQLYQDLCQQISDQQEKSDEDDMSTKFMSTTLLGRVIKETLRLMPPVALLPTRTCEKDQPLPMYNPVTGQQYIIPKGTCITLSFWSIQRNPKYWSNPDMFIPDRWLLPSSNTVERQAFFPFSAGKRPCLGKEFSLIEQRVVITKLLKKFRIIPNSQNCMPTTLKGGIFSTPERVLIRLEHR